MSVEEPHDPGLRVASDSAAEPGAVSLLDNLGLGLGHEAGLEPLSLGLDQLRGSLPPRLHLTDPLNAGHALGQLRLVDDSGLAGGLQDASGLVHAVQVGSPADVLAGVLRVDPAEVHGDVAEVEDGSEAVL